MSTILCMSAQMLFLFFFSGLTLTSSFWETGIIWQFQWSSLLHSFEALGDFFLRLYNWRDSWYGVVKVLTGKVK